MDAIGRANLNTKRILDASISNYIGHDESVSRNENFAQDECKKPSFVTAVITITCGCARRDDNPGVFGLIRVVTKPAESPTISLYHYCDTIDSMVLRLNPSSGVPIYLQIVEQIRHSIEIGALVEGDQLPPIRTLAEELIVSPNTVVKAYDDLEQEGLIRLRHGAGAYVGKANIGKSRFRRFRDASVVVKETVRKLRSMGLSDDESRRLFEAEWIEEAATR
jgi:GntR family transcriptional regulator